MKTRRLAATGIALVAALGLTLTGCKTEAGAPAASAGPSDAAAASAAPADPLAELTSAALKLNEDSVRVTLSSPAMNGGGVMDPRSMAMDMSLELAGAMSIHMLVIGADAFLKLSGLSGAPKKWLHLDATKLGADGQLSLMPDGDPGGARKMISAVAEVEKTGEHSFTGTVDYRKVKPNGKLQQLGDKAAAIPFTARTDDQGRLIELALDMSDVQPAAGQLVTRYTDFGTPVTLSKPSAADTQEAPEELIKAFGGQ
ncbi:hypothetical protein ABZ570_05865 [Micromonospora sp. NPDC007271]|uniref:hypothetical protein n=1 Tax=Micromonospora sp. NPDC007271 TaxID=3154587 RepID=UPI0033C61A26